MDQSASGVTRAGLTSSVVSCCLLGSRVLSGKDAGVLKGEAGSGNELCYFNCGESGGQSNNKRAPPVGL
jgi:hypothetical protein